MSKDAGKDCRGKRTSEHARMILDSIGEIEAERQQMEIMHDQLVQWYQDVVIERDNAKEELRQCRLAAGICRV